MFLVEMVAVDKKLAGKNIKEVFYSPYVQHFAKWENKNLYGYILSLKNVQEDDKITFIKLSNNDIYNLWEYKELQSNKDKYDLDTALFFIRNRYEVYCVLMKENIDKIQ